MKSFLYHLQFNIDFSNISFYKDLMSFLGWSVIFADESAAGFKSGTNGDVWFIKNETKKQNDHGNIGVSHTSIRVEKQKDVDEVIGFLKEKNVPCLFSTPRHRPEFSSPGQTYYQIMFESPDRILLEIVYIGKQTV